MTEDTAKEATVFTDESRSYLWLEIREHKAINLSKAQAEDRDGDGIRETRVCATLRNLDKSFD